MGLLDTVNMQWIKRQHGGLRCGKESRADEQQNEHD
jgi:hypothetical protein